MKNTGQNNYIIYKVQNIWTGQVYIGATTNSIHQRKLDYLERAKRAKRGERGERDKSGGYKWKYIK